mmetsp:Transcript_30366/g.100786  ORF Transcript_30366/g.100786 Transcript_30366/m.100786 type:complete len:309 (-) Transcript_30366:1232-2158(-)
MGTVGSSSASLCAPCTLSHVGGKALSCLRHCRPSCSRFQPSPPSPLLLGWQPPQKRGCPRRCRRHRPRRRLATRSICLGCREPRSCRHIAKSSTSTSRPRPRPLLRSSRPWTSEPRRTSWRGPGCRPRSWRTSGGSPTWTGTACSPSASSPAPCTWSRCGGRAPSCRMPCPRSSTCSPWRFPTWELAWAAGGDWLCRLAPWPPPPEAAPSPQPRRQRQAPQARPGRRRALLCIASAWRERARRGPTPWRRRRRPLGLFRRSSWQRTRRSSTSSWARGGRLWTPTRLGTSWSGPACRTKSSRTSGTYRI